MFTLPSIKSVCYPKRTRHNIRQQWCTSFPLSLCICFYPVLYRDQNFELLLQFSKFFVDLLSAIESKQNFNKIESVQSLQMKTAAAVYPTPQF